jgi:hypothetical protein
MRRRIHHMSMALRLVLAFAVLIGLPALFSAWSYRRALDERRAASLEETVQSAQTMASLVHGLLWDLDGTTLAMSLALGARPEPLDQATVGPYLAAVAARYPYIRSMFLIDLNGQVIASQRGEGVGFDLSGRPYTRQLLGGQEFVLTDVIAGTQTGTPTITMARTVRAADGALRALLAVAFYPDRLTELFPAAPPPT